MSLTSPKFFVPVIAIAGLAFALSVSAVDDMTPPSTVANLAVASTTNASVGLTWTAPGDDGAVGTAASYDVRLRTTGPIDEINFATSTPVAGEPTPHVAGTLESLTVHGLTPTTTYWFALRSTDDAGNTSAVSNVVATTTRADTTAPLISGVSVSNISSSSARVSWMTSESASSQVDYGTTTSYGSSTASSTLMTSHSLDLASLLPSTPYHFIARSADASGNTATSSDHTFTTLATSTPTTTIAARLRVEPSVLNRNREGRKITAVVKLPREVSFRGLDIESIRLNDTVKPIKASLKPKEWKRHGHQRRTLTLKFAASDVLPLIPSTTESFVITVTGTIKAGKFKGTDTIRIIPPPSPHDDDDDDDRRGRLERRMEKIEERLEKRQEELKEREEELKARMEKKQEEFKKKEEKLKEKAKNKEEKLKKKMEKLEERFDD